MTKTKQGKLICVGTGMRMAGQLTPLARSYIETADVVVAAVPNRFAHKWLQAIAKEYVCLLDCYSDCDVEGRNRHDTYQRMSATILQEVHAGKTVCAAFYGHPGIFACVSHMAIQRARRRLPRRDAARLQVLVDKLARDYPLQHPVILYEAATNPLETPRMEPIVLRDLPTALLNGVTTLVIAAAYPLKRDQVVIDQLSKIE